MTTPDPPLRDLTLVEFIPAEVEEAALGDAVRDLAPGADAVRLLSGDLVTIYLDGLPWAGLASRAQAALAPLATGGIEVSRLRAVRAFHGASAGEAAGYHYVVRTDVAPGGEEELLAWYDQEHMPGLAAVPGVVRARRLVSLDAAPLYYACYDLTRPDTLGSPPWLAVRATPWSDRVRPTFRNTRRLMSRRIKL